MIPGCVSPAAGLMIAASLLAPAQPRAQVQAQLQAQAQPAASLSPNVQVQKPAVPVPQGPMEVTTDTPEYCEQLADKVHSMSAVAIAQPPREVSDLSAEGQRMCAHGQTRPGIMRLRRAIMLMKHEDPGPAR